MDPEKCQKLLNRCENREGETESRHFLRKKYALRGVRDSKLIFKTKKRFLLLSRKVYFDIHSERSDKIRPRKTPVKV